MTTGVKRTNTKAENPTVTEPKRPKNTPIPSAIQHVNGAVPANGDGPSAFPPAEILTLAAPGLADAPEESGLNSFVGFFSGNTPLYQNGPTLKGLIRTCDFPDKEAKEFLALIPAEEEYRINRKGNVFDYRYLEAFRKNPAAEKNFLDLSRQFVDISFHISREGENLCIDAEYQDERPTDTSKSELLRMLNAYHLLGLQEEAEKLLDFFNSFPSIPNSDFALMTRAAHSQRASAPKGGGVSAALPLPTATPFFDKEMELVILLSKCKGLEFNDETGGFTVGSDFGADDITYIVSYLNRARSAGHEEMALFKAVEVYLDENIKIGLQGMIRPPAPTPNPESMEDFLACVSGKKALYEKGPTLDELLGGAFLHPDGLDEILFLLPAEAEYRIGGKGSLINEAYKKRLEESRLAYDGFVKLWKYILVTHFHIFIDEDGNAQIEEGYQNTLKSDLFSDPAQMDRFCRLLNAYKSLGLEELTEAVVDELETSYGKCEGQLEKLEAAYGRVVPRTSEAPSQPAKRKSPEVSTVVLKMVSTLQEKCPGINYDPIGEFTISPDFRLTASNKPFVSEFVSGAAFAGRTPMAVKFLAVLKQNGIPEKDLLEFENSIDEKNISCWKDCSEWIDVPLGKGPDDLGRTLQKKCPEINYDPIGEFTISPDFKLTDSNKPFVTEFLSGAAFASHAPMAVKLLTVLKRNGIPEKDLLELENCIDEKNISCWKDSRAWLDFFLGKGTDDLGRTFKEIVDSSADYKQRSQHYIQRIFPLGERSKNEISAPILDPTVKKEFLDNPEVRFALRRAFRAMLAHYGFEYKLGFIVAKEDFSDISKRWRSDPLECERISRILKSLRALGFGLEASSFYLVLNGIPGIPSETKKKWKEAAEDIRLSKGQARVEGEAISPPVPDFLLPMPSLPLLNGHAQTPSQPLQLARFEEPDAPFFPAPIKPPQNGVVSKVSDMDLDEQPSLESEVEFFIQVFLGKEPLRKGEENVEEIIESEEVMSHLDAVAFVTLIPAEQKYQINGEGKIVSPLYKEELDKNPKARENFQELCRTFLVSCFNILFDQETGFSLSADDEETNILESPNAHEQMQRLLNAYHHLGFQSEADDLLDTLNQCSDIPKDHIVPLKTAAHSQIDLKSDKPEPLSPSDSDDDEENQPMSPASPPASNPPLPLPSLTSYERDLEIGVLVSQYDGLECDAEGNFRLKGLFKGNSIDGAANFMKSAVAAGEKKLAMSLFEALKPKILPLQIHTLQKIIDPSFVAEPVPLPLPLPLPPMPTREDVLKEGAALAKQCPGLEMDLNGVFTPMANFQPILVGPRQFASFLKMATQAGCREVAISLRKALKDKLTERDLLRIEDLWDHSDLPQWNDHPAWIEFFLGTGTDDFGRGFMEILNSSDYYKERSHNFIQRIFPSLERSQICPNAPVLDQTMIQAFLKEDGKGDYLRNKALKLAFVAMLDYYGFEEKGNKIESRGETRLSQESHEFSRISRILKSLWTLGLKREAESFCDALISHPDIPKTSKKHWESSVGRSSLIPAAQKAQNAAAGVVLPLPQKAAPAAENPTKRMPRAGLGFLHKFFGGSTPLYSDGSGPTFKEIKEKGLSQHVDGILALFPADKEYQIQGQGNVFNDLFGQEVRRNGGMQTGFGALSQLLLSQHFHIEDVDTKPRVDAINEESNYFYNENLISSLVRFLNAYKNLGHGPKAREIATCVLGYSHWIAEDVKRIRKACGLPEDKGQKPAERFASPGIAASPFTGLLPQTAPPVPTLQQVRDFGKVFEYTYPGLKLNESDTFTITPDFDGSRLSAEQVGRFVEMAASANCQQLGLSLLNVLKPFLKEDDPIKLEAILDNADLLTVQFFLGKTFDDILKGSKEYKQGSFHFIQRLFPSRNSSQCAPGTPVLSDEMVKSFLEDGPTGIRLKRALKRAFLAALDYYGFRQRMDGLVQEKEDFCIRERRWKANPSEWQRISQMLESLVTLGLGNEAYSFYHILRIVRNDYAVPQETKEDWDRIMRNLSSAS